MEINLRPALKNIYFISRISTTIALSGVASGLPLPSKNNRRSFLSAVGAIASPLVEWIATCLGQGGNHDVSYAVNYKAVATRKVLGDQTCYAVEIALTRISGHAVDTWKDVADDTSYLITSKWPEEQAFLNFIHSQAFKDVTRADSSGRPQHKI
jgi:hypothetical protein